MKHRNYISLAAKFRNSAGAFKNKRKKFPDFKEFLDEQDKEINDTIEVIAKEVADRICAMDKEEFDKLLEEHKDGDISLALQELYQFGTFISEKDRKKELTMEEFFEDTFSEEFLKQAEEEYRKLKLEQIDDLIEEWHDNKIKLKLHEYLNMTQEEYSQFVEKSIIPKNWRPRNNDRSN